LIGTSLFGSSADFAPDSILIASRTYPISAPRRVPEKQGLTIGIVVVSFHPRRVADHGCGLEPGLQVGRCAIALSEIRMHLSDI